MKCSPTTAGVLLGLSLLRLPLLGQDATNSDATGPSTNSAATRAAAIAEQQDTDERFKRLAADIESLRAANQSILDKLAALKDDFQQIRADQAKLAASAISRDDLKPLAQRIEEVDKKREDDKQLISDQLKKTAAALEKLFATRVEPVPLAPVRNQTNTAAPTDGFSYQIKDGDRLVDILAAYNKDFESRGLKRISLKQAEEANSDVDWAHLKVGQKIVIPRPPEQ